MGEVRQEPHGTRAYAMVQYPRDDRRGSARRLSICEIATRRFGHASSCLRASRQTAEATLRSVARCQVRATGLLRPRLRRDSGEFLADDGCPLRESFKIHFGDDSRQGFHTAIRADINALWRQNLEHFP